LIQIQYRANNTGNRILRRAKGYFIKNRKYCTRRLPSDLKFCFHSALLNLEEFALEMREEESIGWAVGSHQWGWTKRKR
jgi:hypothetical protein